MISHDTKAELVTMPRFASSLALLVDDKFEFETKTGDAEQSVLAAYHKLEVLSILYSKEQSFWNLRAQDDYIGLLRILSHASFIRCACPSLKISSHPNGA